MDFLTERPLLFLLVLFVGGYLIWLLTGGPERAEPKWNGEGVSVEGVDFDRILGE